MLSVIFLVLIFLANVYKVSSSIDDKHCEWFCSISVKRLLTARKTEVRLNISKLIDRKCAANPLYRYLQNTTSTGYVLVFPLHDYHDRFSFVQFSTKTALEHTLQTEQMDKKKMNVSCLLQPMSRNQAEMAEPNGLDDLKSLRRYVSLENRIWNTPFVGCVHLETNYFFSAGFSNENVSEDFKITVISFFFYLSRLIGIWCILRFPLVLTSFCRTFKKIKINNDHVKGKPQQHEDSGIQDQSDVSKQCMTQSDEARSTGVPFKRPIEQPSGSSAKTTTGSKKGDRYVDFIEVSPVSIRSFFSNYVFLNKAISNEGESNEGERNEVCYPMVRFVILSMFPITILLGVDVFVFWIPRLFIQGLTNLPSPYLTELVFTFAFEKHPGLFVCFLVFVLRMSCLCFKPSSKVCSIPDNIQQNFELFAWETLKKKWKYASKKKAENRSFLLQLVWCIVKDFIMSLPIVSLCHGGCWYTDNWFKNKLAKSLVLFLEFVSIFMSIVWVAYISCCCSLSLEMAIISLMSCGTKYPVETLSSVYIFVLTWYCIWKLFSLFTNIYVKLLNNLFKICKDHYGKEMKKYKTENKMYLPKNLFDQACNEFEPVSKNFIKLLRYLFWFTIYLFVLFSIVFGTECPKYIVLPVTVTSMIITRALLEVLSFEESYKEGDLENLVHAHFPTKIE